MSRVLIQLFEITGQFDMHLRPELVLLQKTMMTAGVAPVDLAGPRHLDGNPVVRRWMTRELSPAARLAGRTGWARPVPPVGPGRPALRRQPRRAEAPEPP
jgi:predicted unusual protein kinase regulating ubiquinone biosynthesis (AarF/ABC1/UbiB family)